MKKIITAISFLLLVTSVNAFAKINATDSRVASFEGGTINRTENGRYQVDGLTVSDNFQTTQGEINYVYGKFGKNADDASLVFKFDKNEKREQCNLTMDLEKSVELGQKIHYSVLYTDEDSISSLRIVPTYTTSSGTVATQHKYEPIQPATINSNWNRVINHIIAKYDGYVYFADTGAGIIGAQSIPNKWHRYDIVIDTQDESQDGVQTVKLYYDGSLYAYGKLDSDINTDGVQRIQKINGLNIEITTFRDGGTAYLDDIAVTILDEEAEPELLVNGKSYGGSYRSGDTAKFLAPFAKTLPMVAASYGKDADADYKLFYPDSNGDISAELGDGGKDPTLFLWTKDTFSPLTVQYTFVPYNPTEKLNINCENNADIAAEQGSAVPNAQSGTMNGALGKSESFFYASNGEGSVSTTDARQLETAIRADINTEYKEGESLWLSFDYASKSNAYPKSIYVKPKNGLSREFITISTDGDVRIGQVPVTGVKITPNQWYRFDIVLNTNLRGSFNTSTIYINGVKCAENFPIYLGETSIKDGRVIESLKVAYNLSSSGTVTADGIYFDNLKVQLCSGFLPEITEYSVKSSDTIYDYITNYKSFTIEQYGQNTESYISLLNGDAIASATFVSADGATATELPAAGEGYLKVTTVDGFDIYYSLTEGTDDKVRASIDPVENDYNFDTTDWYAYTAPDINKITAGDNILNVAEKNPVKAGSLSPVSTSGEYFMVDGKPIKFWGCNFILSAAVPTNEQADKMADMVASYGFNLVRIHGLTDSRTKILNDDGQTLNDDAMNKFCYLINKLNEKGIYIYIDLGRGISEADVQDGSIEKIMPGGHVFWFEDDYQNIQIDFAKQLLTYKYNGTRLCDMNSIMGVQCVNEAYIYMNSFEEALGFESEEFQYYYAKMNEKFDAWYRKTFPDYKTQVTRIGLSQAEANGALITIGSYDQRGGIQHADGGWGYTPWIYTARQQNTVRFFNEMQADYFAKMQAMFDDNDINIPMTGSTVWHSNDLALMDANLDTKFIDTHTYWGHPQGGFGVETGMKFNDWEMQSMLKSPQLGLIGYIMNRKPYNKPYTITEWNECAGNPYMAEGPLMMAAYSKYQNWNPFLFMFMETPMANYKNTYINNAFAVVENPIMLSTLQAAALTWRNVSEATENCFIDYSGSKSYEYSKHHHEYYDSATQAWKPAGQQYAGYDIITTNPTRGLLAKTGASVRVAPANNNISDKQAAALASGIYTSDTNELTFNSNDDTFTVNTSKSKAAAGFFKNETTIGDAVKFTFDNEFATVYVNSVTDNDIPSSNRLLLTVAGKAANTDRVMQRSGSPYVIRGGKAPVLMEQITGTVKIKTNSAKKVYALTSSGEHKKEIAATYSDGWLTIPLSLSDECVNYEIVQ
ncbi:MAG: hypothetical protein PUF08_00915 [Clostridiales bacterium]|nr:hypothetical protein [Clostridiales bacterium]